MLRQIYDRITPAACSLAIFLAAVSAACAASNTYPEGGRLTWSGISWITYGGPSTNTWVDSEGQLHIVLQKSGATWTGMSFESSQWYSFGKYIWKVASNSLNFETGTTFGMFTYTNDTHEIDIEINEWPGYDEHAWFTNQPGSVDEHPQNVHYGVPAGSPYLNATNLTYTIDWEPTYIDYSIVTDYAVVISSWHYTLADAIPKVPAKIMHDLLPMPYGGPVSGTTQEVVLTSFQYIPPATVASTGTISGYVRDGGGNGVGGVTMTLTGSASHSTTTGSDGSYQFPGLACQGSYTVTPAKTSWSFSPVSISTNALTADMSNGNFSGSSTYPDIVPADSGEVKVVGAASGRGVIDPDRGETAKIFYRGSGAGRFELRIFTLTGELVWDTAQESAGEGMFEWIPRDIASGIYIARVDGPGVNTKKRVAILR